MNASSRIDLNPTCVRALATRKVAAWAALVLAASVKPGVWFPPFGVVGIAAQVYSIRLGSRSVSS